jgi:choline dehydrogenase
MGKVVGGGSSINVMVWARGHKNDWDYFADESGDKAWGYESVLSTYRRIEDWYGTPDPDYRGTHGPIYVEPAQHPNPVAPAIVEAAPSVNIPKFENQNGRMMEGPAGAAITDVCIRAGYRQSVFRSYIGPYLGRPNLTVLTGAMVTRVCINDRRATGVEFLCQGMRHHVDAAVEVVLSLGAIHTPKLLMQSGVGDEDELGRHGIAVVQHLPGVGQNFQDHPGVDCVWEYQHPLAPRNNASEATLFWKSAAALETPDLQACQSEIPKGSAENVARFGLPSHGWGLFVGVVRPKSRGRVRLTGPAPLDPVDIEANMLSHPDDMKAAVAGIDICRELGNSPLLRPFVKREVMPGNLKGAALEHFIRDAAVSYWHQTGTAKMGTDELSVVDATLKVYGIERLRIADGSIMPRVTTGNTMAPCVIIGERAADMIKVEHHLQ